MKSALYFFSFLLLCSFQHVIEKKTGWEEDGLKGNVKQIKQQLFFARVQYETEAVIDWANGSSFDYKDYSKSYNEKGLLTNEITYGENAAIDQQVFYLYDKKGNETESRTCDGSSQLFSKGIYKYDERARITEELHFMYDDSLVVNTSITSNYSERTIRRTIAYKNDTSKTRVILKLDEQGNEIEHSWYNPNGELWQRTVFKYDAKRKPVEILYYTYNKSFNEDQLASMFYYKYDEHGNQTEWTWFYPPTYEQGKLHYKRTWKYEYDAHGNWITKTEFYNNASTCIAKREILYYD